MWRNTNSGVVHAHSIMVCGWSRWTACGRVELWPEHGELRTDFESHWPEPGDRLCQHCVATLQSRIEWTRTWLERRRL